MFRLCLAASAVGLTSGAGAAGSGGVPGFAAYSVDPEWRPKFPPGAGMFSAVAVSGDEVFISQRKAAYRQPVLVMGRDGALLRGFGADVIPGINGTYGSHGLSMQLADPDIGRPEDTVWVMDFFTHTVMSFSVSGALLGRAGRPPSSPLPPGAFGSVADAAFREGDAYFADGDGGVANRIERWAAAEGRPDQVQWASAGKFSNPHGICWHRSSDTLLVADRDNARIVVVDPETGHSMGALACDGLKLGAGGKPYAVEVFQYESLDLLFVATANNPQDGKNQFVHIVDASPIGTTGACGAVLQSIPLSPTAAGGAACRTPHLLGVDAARGDVYVACVSEPGSNVLRLVVPQKKEEQGAVASSAAARCARAPFAGWAAGAAVALALLRGAESGAA